jgi:ABC-type antimicrobial peptide transport system permease subunit
MYAMFGIVYISIGIVVLNAMLMAVFERIREFGVLKALGMGPGRVLSLILLESFIQVGIAVLVGLFLAFPLNAYLSEIGIDLSASMQDVTVAGVVFDPIWRSVVRPETYIRPTIALWVIVTVAALYPAIRAARIRPVEAMRHR